MLHSMVVGVGVVIAAGLAFAIAVQYLSESRNANQRICYEPRDPDITNVPTFGNCSHCDGPVDALNGYALVCNHPLHYTCSTYIKGILKDSTKLCRICVGSDPRRPQEGWSEG